MELDLFSLIITVGPTNCGKTFFTKNVLIPKLTNILKEKNIKPNIQYVSSDQIRRNCLNDDLSKYDQQMMEISSQVFDLLLYQTEI